MFRTLGTITIADDRGRPCRLVAPPARWPKELRRALRSPQLQHVALKVEFDVVRKSGGFFGAGIASWPLYPPIARSIRKGAADRLRAAYLASHCCPSCGFALAGLTPGADHHVVCPECGSAWANQGCADRIQNPSPLQPA